MFTILLLIYFTRAFWFLKSFILLKLVSKTVCFITNGFSNEFIIFASVTWTWSSFSKALRLLEVLLRVFVGLNVCCCWISICSCFLSVEKAWPLVLIIDPSNESRFLFFKFYFVSGLSSYTVSLCYCLSDCFLKFYWRDYRFLTWS